MKSKTSTTEQAILEAAEKLFIEKGYDATKTTEISKAAGVNHAMLHYYFRTKENLFTQIFEQKAVILLGFLTDSFEDDGPFLEKLGKGIEMHFDFLSQNIELPLFVLREVVQDKRRKAFIIEKIFPVGKELTHKMHSAIEREVKKGRIRPIKTYDLLLNIASLNVFTFVAAQVLFDIEESKDSKELKSFLETRKKNNVEIIINSLKY
jgi:AcrR family transcriptional regulator